MKRNYVLFLVVFCILLVSCSFNKEEGVLNGDWSYYLTDTYYISRVNTKCIILCKQKSKHSGTAILDEFIEAFCYNENTALLKVRKTYENDTEHWYYSFDKNTGDLSESFDEDELQIILLHDGPFCKWIETNVIPEGAVFT